MQRRECGNRDDVAIICSGDQFIVCVFGPDQGDGEADNGDAKPIGGSAAKLADPDKALNNDCQQYLFQALA